MRSTVFIFALLGAAWAFPKGVEELQDKRLYVDPLQTINGIVPLITNGREAVPHSIPYQAYLIVTGTDGSRWSCGGSLISRNYVVTAAHCLFGGKTASVYLGAHNLEAAESSRVLITSISLIPHENYNENTISNDIGLIQLSTPATLNENINVISLPRRGASTYEGRSGRISGFGLTAGSERIPSSVLLEVNSTIIANPTCNSYYGVVEDSEVCTSGAGGVGACSGDSGGPLVVDNELVGVVSYGVTGCVSGYPSAFARVSSFLDFIERYADV